MDQGLAQLFFLVSNIRMKTAQNILALSLVLILTSTLVSCKTQPEIAGTPAPAPDPKKVRYERPKDGSKETQLNIPYRSLDTEKLVNSFAFGSCADQNQPQPLWSHIANQKPNLVLMMGDNVYASSPANKPIIDQYIKLNGIPPYKDLREAVPFLATWDDHDFGQQDGGADNPEKEEARRVFLNYWSYLKFSLPKDQKQIYHSRIVGPKKQQVQFIMLDTRWDRSPLVKNPDYNSEDPAQKANPKMYIPTTDKKTNLLGEGQWAWLESELKKPVALRILVSSIQVIPNDHSFEKWGNFPHERERLFNLLAKHKVKNLVILSGDRHAASLAKYDVPRLGTVYEVTASAFNKPSPAAEPEKDSTYLNEPYLQINYGLAHIDWSKNTVKFEIRDDQDGVRMFQSVKF